LIFLQIPLQHQGVYHTKDGLLRLFVKIIPYSWSIKLFRGDFRRADVTFFEQAWSAAG